MSRFHAACALLLLALAAGWARPAGAQYVAFDVSDDGCLTAWDWSGLETVSYGFHVSAVSGPDVEYDQTHVGGPTVGGPESGLFLYHWRDDVRSDSELVVVVLTNEGRLAVDSDLVGASNGWLGVVHSQVAVSAPGLDAPSVTLVPSGWEVAWEPVLEVNATPIGPTGDCTLGGAGSRGFFVGYNVYRLPASTFPAPSLRDFLVSGYLAHADVSLLDFDVADADGFQGSDLDTSDRLRLVNPDGAPDTGDEVLIFQDCSELPEPHWFRIQPVVRGSIGYFAGGGTTVLELPSTLHDLTGDGVVDTVDVLDDGHFEFIDPSGRGLGLVHDDEIFSSRSAGLGPPAGAPCGPAPIRCAGNLVIGGCDTGVAALRSDGTCLTDLVAALPTGSRGSGAFVAALTAELSRLRAEGVLTARELLQALRCARSSTSRPSASSRRR